MYGILDVSTSGLVAQRARLEVVSANLANLKTLTNAAGEYEPYRRRFAVFAAGDPARDSAQGVHIASIGIDQGPLLPTFEPGSPFADPNGYVYYPNVDPTVELMNGMEAQRAYEANISAVEATKSMVSVALQIIA